MKKFKAKQKQNKLNKELQKRFEERCNKIKEKAKFKIGDKVKFFVWQHPKDLEDEFFIVEPFGGVDAGYEIVGYMLEHVETKDVDVAAECDLLPT